MIRLSRNALGAAALGLTLIGATATATWSQTAPNQAVVGISSVSSYLLEGRVTAVDMNTRMVTLALTDGRTVSRKAGPAVANLGQLKAGDVVTATSEERLTFVLSGHDARLPGDRKDIAVARKPAGQKPGGVVRSQTVESWLIVSVNVAANTISLVDPEGGQVRTFDVTTPQGRAQLPRAKAGDYLTAVETEITVVSVTRKS